MKSLADLQPLLRMGQGRLHSCHLQLSRCQAHIHPLGIELAAVQAQLDGLRSVLGNTLIHDARLSRAELLAGLRRQAVVRRQMQMLMLEKARLQQQLDELSAQLDTQRRQQRTLHERQHKYQRLQVHLLRRQALSAQRLEEHENEDLLRSR